MPLHFLIHLYLQQGITVIVTTSHILSRNQLSNRSASIARYIGRLPISDGPNHPFNHQKAEFPAGMLLFYNDFRRMTKSPISAPSKASFESMAVLTAIPWSVSAGLTTKGKAGKSTRSRAAASNTCSPFFRSTKSACFFNNTPLAERTPLRAKNCLVIHLSFEIQ